MYRSDPKPELSASRIYISHAIETGGFKKKTLGGDTKIYDIGKNIRFIEPKFRPCLRGPVTIHLCPKKQKNVIYPIDLETESLSDWRGVDFMMYWFLVMIGPEDIIY